ncbi:olfactory receptor 6C1-like [Discoglossus pictus]
MAFHNQTQFILLGFPSLPKVQASISVVLLCVYLLCLFGNIVIIFAVCIGQHLHTPMYYFLSNLASLDILFITTTVPKLLSTMMNDNSVISLNNCLLQFYFYYSLGGTEFCFLALMSLDRYLAICQPLRYNTIMTNQFCWRLITGSWIYGFLEFIPAVVYLSKQHWCRRFSIINHFFCDGSALLKLSCSDTYVAICEYMILGFASFTILSSFISTLTSYCCILSSIFAMSSSSGRKKTFSTCSSHLIAVSIIYGSCIFIYVRPAGTMSSNIEKIVAVLNSIFIPFLNPFIYTLRNQMVKKALREFWIYYSKS